MNTISPINFNNIYPNKPTSQINQKLSQQRVGDTFVHSNNIHFGAKTNLKLSEKFYPFYKDLHSYMQKTSNFEFKDIEKIIQKYSPTTTVASMAEIPPNANTHEHTMAYFSNMTYFSPNGEAIAGDKKIYVDLPKDNSKESKITFIESLCHEITHIFQEESSDRLSKTDFLNKNIKGKKLTPDVICNLQAMPNIFSIAEINIVTPLYKTLAKDKNMPEPIIDTSKKLLDRIYLVTTGKSCDDYISTIIDKSIDFVQSRSIFPLDRKLMLKYTALIADKEREAYKNTAIITKNELGLNCKTDYDLRVTLYDTFVNMATEMSKK